MDLMLDKVPEYFCLFLSFPILFSDGLYYNCCAMLNFDFSLVVAYFLRTLYDIMLCAAELFSDVQPFVQSALDGYNVSIFAYGQTHSGKTHTMVCLSLPSPPALYSSMHVWYVDSNTANIDTILLLCMPV